jgi:hypothetical protein
VTVAQFEAVVGKGAYQFQGHSACGHFLIRFADAPAGEGEKRTDR